jgi:PAS domain S-box-containing protein
MSKAASPYLLAFLALAAAVLLRLLLGPLLGDHVPFVTLFGAVAVGVWLGGYQLGALVALVGYPVSAYLFIEPRGTLGLGSLRDIVSLTAYLLTCAIIIGFGEAMRIARQRADIRRETLRVTLACMGDAVITTDREGQIASINSVASSLTGWTEESALGQPLDTVFRIVNEETKLPVENPATRSLREGAIVGLANHTSLISKDEKERPIDDSAAPIRTGDGVTVGCVLIFRDISERRAMEREAARQLHTSRLLASIVESSDDAIVSKTLDGVIQTWNSAAERIFGYSAEHAVGRHISLIIPPDRLKEEDRILARLKAGERIDHYETVRQRSDGRRVEVSLSISPLLDSEGRVVGASKIARDITERKRAEADRRRLASVVENSTDFIGICDMDLVPYYVNRAGLHLVGLGSLDEACRTPVREFFFPEDQSQIVDSFVPAVLARNDGETEVRFRHFTTGAAIWMLYRVFALTNAEGERIGLATISRDITQRRQLEEDLRKLAAELSEGNRRKDEFLAMLAHELRNPLAPIVNGLQVLRLTASENSDAHSAYDMMERQVSQMVRLIDDLLDVSRIARGKIDLKRERVDLAPIVRQAAEVVGQACADKKHVLHVTVPDMPIYVDGDPTRIAQVIGNLLTNACKFTDPGGAIWLKLESENETAIVRVRDTGAGIERDHLSQIFQMFHQIDSTREKSQGGLGIGLSLAKSIVELHGGTIDVFSEGTGQGAEFVIRLPIVADEFQSSVNPDDEMEQTSPQMRSILVVDDNRDSAESLAMLLRLTGNRVSTAHDGLEAIEVAESQKPDVILLDIGLPKLNGYEACRKIREQAWGQQIKIVALTGWGQDDDRRRSKEAGFDGHLVKPVEHAALHKLFSAILPLGTVPTAVASQSRRTIRAPV